MQFKQLKKQKIKQRIIPEYIEKTKLRSRSEMYQGALDNTYIVQAFRKSGNKWQKAQIVDYRLAKNYQHPCQKSPSSYEYYIHYERLNSRQDEWLPKELVRPCRKRRKVQTVQLQQNNSIKSQKTNSCDLGIDSQSVFDQENNPKIKTIEKIQIGRYSANTWYPSPYFANSPFIPCLYICQFCLSYFLIQSQLKRHNAQCQMRHPPGILIYRDGELCVFEVQGQTNPVYCQNLALLSKLFIDNKSLKWDMSVFYFYILCQYKDNAYHFMGCKIYLVYWCFPSTNAKVQANFQQVQVINSLYYKKELVLLKSLYLTQVYIINMQYCNNIGKQAYFSWWAHRIVEYILEHQQEQITFNSISLQTGMVQADIEQTMQKLDMYKVSLQTIYLRADTFTLSSILKKTGKGRLFKKELLKWIPFIQNQYQHH